MGFDKKANRFKRKARIRKKISGTKQKPRLSVYRSNRNLYIQAIDDEAGRTLVSVSSVEKQLRKDLKGNNMAAAGQVAAVFAERSGNKGIKSMVFDRNGRAYHGRVKQIAETLRENGIRI